MARDRQRAKQRRRARRPSGGGPAAGSRNPRARELGLDDSSVEEAGLGEGTPAPEPLEHALPDVEMAEMAEAGAPPPTGAGEDMAGAEIYDDERAPDELERDLAPAGARRVDRDRDRSSRGRLFTFLGHVVDELRRVQWPNRRQVGQGTAVTLGFVVLAGGYLGLMDAIWQPLIEAIL
jgi:preprotein translocase SecE subunit